jgi:GTP-binding protein EngB required for normal cell division
MSSVAQRVASDLDARLEALNDAVAVGSGRLPEGDLALTRSVLTRSGQRLGLGVGYTVAALAGGTGSGKSSLFNSLAGRELSVAGARRPTTGVTHACVWGEAAPDALLDWLAVPRRHHHQTTGQDDLEGLVLLDLPDSDSTELAHRVEVDRLVEIVDLLVWVLDPQKYADSVMHDRYLRPLATHAGVMLLVLNQVDRLDRGGRDTCLGDIKRLARADGLGNVPVISTSATTGEGMDQLKSELTQRVDARRTATERLAADVARAVDRLNAFCDSKKEPRDIKGTQRGALIDALAEAGAVERVTDAVAQAHMHRAILATGSPFTRWLRRLRPDPLRRLHLSPRLDTSTRTSLPAATPVQRAQVGTALRRLSDSAGADLPSPWPALVKARATSDEDRLPGDLDRVVAHSNVGDMRAPRWWRVLGALQTALAATAIAGALWLTVLFFFDWMKFPSLPLPRVDRLPVPTLLLVGGLLAGVIVAFIGRQLAAVGGRRRKRSARQRLRAGIEQLADERIVMPINDELDAYRSFCAALQRARGGRRARRGQG